MGKTGEAMVMLARAAKATRANLIVGPLRWRGLLLVLSLFDGWVICYEMEGR